MAGGVRAQVEAGHGLLLLGHDTVRDRARDRPVERVQRQLPGSSDRGGAAERVVGGAAELHGARGPPRGRFLGDEAAGRHEAPNVGLRCGLVWGRIDVLDGQMGLTFLFCLGIVLFFRGNGIIGGEKFFIWRPCFLNP